MDEIEISFKHDDNKTATHKLDDRLLHVVGRIVKLRDSMQSLGDRVFGPEVSETDMLEKREIAAMPKLNLRVDEIEAWLDAAEMQMRRLNHLA